MADVALAAAAPAGTGDFAPTAAARKDSVTENSAFHKIKEDDAAALRDTSDNLPAGDLPGKLASIVSGPLLHSAATISDLDTVRDVPFDRLCNGGNTLTGKNFFNKLLFRWFLTPIK
jgi:hypothetical protein